MNYSNFTCRLSAPRRATVAPPEAGEKVQPKKTRKVPARRRTLSATVTGLALMLLLAMNVAIFAEEVRPMLRIVPAPGTVVYAAGPERDALADDELIWIEESEEPVPLATHVEALKAHISQVTQPTPARLSTLTAILLGGGVAVALFRVKVLFQPGTAY